MEDIIWNGKNIDLKSASMNELNEMLKQTNDDEKKVKEEIDKIINKLNQNKE